METEKNEENLLRAVALQNAQSILAARQRAEWELVEAKEVLERKVNELDKQRRWFKGALSSIGDAVITTDTEHKITFLNPLAELLTGWKLKEALGQRLAKVVHVINEETREPAIALTEEVLRQDNRTYALTVPRNCGLRCCLS
ncbi:MAG: PAS domain-containing protein, partial [Pseudomonadota bacterium]